MWSFLWQWVILSAAWFGFGFVTQTGHRLGSTLWAPNYKLILSVLSVCSLPPTLKFIYCLSARLNFLLNTNMIMSHSSVNSQMDCYCLLKYKLKSNMVIAERTFPQGSSTSFSTVAFLAPGLLVSSHTFCESLHILSVYFFLRSFPDLGISHQLPPKAWAWSSFSKLPSTLAPFQDSNLHCHLLPIVSITLLELSYFSFCMSYILSDT